jgi:asparagine synthase (glutamine-hydrolysing)
VSGIAGIYFSDGRNVDPGIFEKMLSSLAHRGPDGCGTWITANIGLGQRSFWTTPESEGENPPKVSVDGSRVVVADARIDNREELLTKLKIEGDQREGICDAELILRAYEHFGEDCPKILVGDYAFAIWDDRRKHLFAARDHIGVKPFYYYHSPGMLVFASEIKALLTLSKVPRILNEVRVAEYLVNFYEDKGITFYKDIYRLPPAFSLIMSTDGLSIHPYWSLDVSVELNDQGGEWYASAFREIFEEAVISRLRSTQPVGFALSGGLDSTSVACTARSSVKELNSQPLSTYSMLFSDMPEVDRKRIDERKYINSVLSGGGFDGHFVEVGSLSPMGEPDKIFRHLDEVYYAPTSSMYWAMYRVVHKDGYRIFLEGIDGDETVSHGLERLPDLAVRGRWSNLYKEARDLSENLFKELKPGQVLWKYGFRPIYSASAVRLLNAIRRKSELSNRNSVIRRQFAERTAIEERVLSKLPVRYALGYSPREIHCNRLNSGTITTALEFLDKVTSSFPLEARYPFFDRRLMEFCLSLPAEQKLSRGWTRYVLRNAMADFIPKAVRWRSTKADLNRSYRRNLFKYDKALLERVIYDDSGYIEPYVDLTRLRTLFEQYSANPMKNGRNADPIYGAVNLSLWLEYSGISR